MPIWVTTPYRRAASVIVRASITVCVSGFWQNTCLPACRAAIVMTAWVWSGVAMITASMPFSFSSITR